MSENIQNLPDASVDAGVPKALNYIEKLVAELCPEGVEYVELGRLGKRNSGTSITAAKMKQIKNPGGEIRIFAAGNNNITAKSNDVPEKDILLGPSIIVKSRGHIGFEYYEGKFTHKSELWSYTLNNGEVNQKYVYYFLLTCSQYLQKLARSKSVKLPQLAVRDTDNLLVPIPPLEVQNAIVEILDKFTKLEAELEAELAARRAQYEYYRKLLLEDITNRVSVERVELSEIFDISNGYTPKKSVSSYWDDGNVPWFRMEDIRRNGRVLSESLIKVHESAVKKSGLFPENSIIVATSATIGEHALIKIPFLCNQRFTALVLKEKYINKLDRKFLFYYCFLLDEWCRNNTTQSSFASVDMKGFRKFVFPVPSLTDQERIVSILDKFDALVNDISSGLPAEIEARRKQYEYYRDRLLTFPRKFEPAEQAMQR